MDDNCELCSVDITRLEREWQAIAYMEPGTVFKVSADYYDQYLLLKLDDLKSPEGDRVFLR